MDYEKKYKNLVKAVKELQEANPSDEGIQNWVNGNVPELAESEDEKTRKVLIELFNDMEWDDSLLHDYKLDKDKTIAWLEKQGKKPKFNIGDWIVEPRGDKPDGLWHIEKIEDGYYLEDTRGICIDIDFADRHCHPWTIADAKDGDILTFKNVCLMSTIICKSPTSYDTKSYCRLIDEHFIEKEENGWDSRLLVPSTKAQCDLLFQKMREAGYGWNENKKELKKIKKNAWSEEDDSALNNILDTLVHLRDGSTVNEIKESFNGDIAWLNSLKERLQKS